MARQAGHPGGRGSLRLSPQLAARRPALVGLAAGLLPVGRAAAAEPSPYELAGKEPLGLDARGRILACPTQINPNCVSTSSLNSAYAPPWRAPEGATAEEAVASIKEAVAESFPGASKLAEESAAPKGAGIYLLFVLRGDDDKLDKIEFLVKGKDEVVDRDWDGDRPGLTVVYRSLAGSVRYAGWITQPISDFGKQRDRMRDLRARLGWSLIGCELLECYEAEMST